MAHQDEVSKVPVLVAPREQSVVSADRVTFIWKPARQARGYRVQVARDSSFEDVVFESEPLNRTEFTLRGQLAADEDTYYWRVLVEDEEGDVHGGDNIESFVSGTTDSAKEGFARPDQDEDLGPAEGLFRGAAAEAANEVTQSPRWVQEEGAIGVEHEGIEAAQILGLVLAIVVAIGLAVFTVFEYVDITAQAARIGAAGTSGYPELRENRLRNVQLLTEYEVLDPGEGRYRIPIERAMDLMVQEARERPASAYSPELNALADDR